MSGEDVPGYDRARATGVYNRGPENGLPGGTYLLVISAAHCPYCQRSLVNTNYDEAASNGMPIRWVDLDRDATKNMLRGRPEFGRNAEGRGTLLDTPIGTPMTVLVRDGQIVEVMKVGEIANSQELDTLATRAQVQRMSSLSPAEAELPSSSNVRNAAVRSDSVGLA